MILFSVCLVATLLFCLITWQNPMQFIKRICAVNWRKFGRGIKRIILKRCARFASNLVRPILQFYYVLRDPDASFFLKLLIYACLIYIVWPFDIIPQLLYRILGTTDDIVVLAFVMSYIKKHIPPSAHAKVESTLNHWFGVKYCVAS